MRRRFAEGTIACKRMPEATRARRTSNPAAADRAPLAKIGSDAAQGAIPAHTWAACEAALHQLQLSRLRTLPRNHRTTLDSPCAALPDPRKERA